MTYGVTPQWVAQQAAGAKIPVKEGWKDGALTIFVPGRPTHFKGKGHRFAVSKHTKDWRDRTATRVYLACVGKDYRGETPSLPWPATAPKAIAFTIYGASRFDDDNARLVCSPCRDALKTMRVIDDDRESSGHRFEYRQAKPTRSAGAVHGIAIEIRLRSRGPAPTRGEREASSLASDART